MNKIRRLFKALGPGFITGASDDDPSGIGTYAQTGAIFGFSQAWTAVFSFPFMSVIQEMCGRIGMVTGMGLARVIKMHYARPVLYGAVLLLLVANTINIGANLGAMASSAQLLIGIPFVFWLIGLTAFTLILEIFVPYPAYARILKYLAFSLLAYIITAFVVKQNWGEVLRSTLVPSFSMSREYLFNIVAILGTTISPYLFFWQADEEVEEEVQQGKIRHMGAGIPRVTRGEIHKMRWDTVAGMFFSNLVMFFIIVTTASTLHSRGITSIETADQAAEILRPLAGDFAFLLFAAGIIGTGLLAIPILAGSASYAVSEVFNWKEGLSRKFTQAHGFYGVITIATLIGLLVNFTPIQPFTMLYYTAILNGVAAPPLMILIMLTANNKKIMGQNTNSLFSNSIGWTITAVMTVAAIALVLSFIGLY
ncbi:MAG: divalent metal cation transporter [Candidatus Levyibacteriota bacterium]